MAKTILLVGGTGELGLALARALYTTGDTLILQGIGDLSAAQALAAECPGNHEHSVSVPAAQLRLQRHQYVQLAEFRPGAFYFGYAGDACLPRSGGDPRPFYGRR